ncbi:MAG: molybdopterin cofactor-binding domain-containing protein [Gammaproteobacteria bacterium]
MNTIKNVSRRKFIRGVTVSTGGLVLGLQLAPASLSIAAVPKQSAVLSPNVFLSIDRAGTVTLIAHRSEMGTGIRTSLPMIMADELEADWSRVVVEQATGDKKYGDQYTDGSRSVVKNYDRMRQFGATARRMLEEAAARQWGVNVSECKAQNHKVMHSSGKSLDYGELVETAASLPVPATDQVTLKDPKDFRYIGKEVVSIVDLPDIITGNAVFGIDVQLPGMKYASIEHCPVTLGKVKSHDDSEALNVPGVEAVVEIPATGKPVLFKSLGGLAVVASNTWAAIEGRKKLKIEWDYGDNASYDSDAYRKQLQATARKAGDIRREEGDVNKAFEGADKVVEAEYYVPHFVHAQMEPPAAVAHVHDGICEVWSSTQDAQAARDNVASAIEFDKADVVSRVPLLGGAFGRKSKPDFIAEAAWLARETGRPVRVTWTREDDIRHGFYHAVSAQHCKAALDKNGKTIAWRHRTVFPAIMSTFTGEPKVGTWELDFGLTDLPFDIPNICIESGTAPEHVRIGWLRSVQNIFHAFAVHSFVNELAVAAGRDPLEYNLELIGKARKVDLAKGGVEDYFNYDNTLEKYPIDTGRLANVLQLAANKAGYGKSLPQREGMGVVAHRSFLTYVATAVHAAVSKDGKVSIPRVDVAIDAGRIVNPDRVRAQMEGAVIYGMSAACYNEITAREGRIQQSNYHDYPVVRMADSPREINVHIVESDAPPGGAGEPGTPGFAPALCNAIFAATGKRIRDLPITNHNLAA